jgi:formate dehydrogenase subunit beta
MNTHWIIQTRGDPLGTVQKFLAAVWVQGQLQGMLVSLEDGEDAGSEGGQRRVKAGKEHPNTRMPEHRLAKPRLIDDPAQLEKVNPFKPLMTINAARLVPDLLEKHPYTRLAALLRPCEMRALVEMTKHAAFKIDSLLTISVDCLGTVPVDEYRWRAARKEAGSLDQEILQFARQGGILAYRYRPACQVCVSPEGTGADINIHVLGLPVRQRLLIQARHPSVAERLQLNTITDGKGHRLGESDAETIRQHQRVLARLNEQRRRSIQRVERSLGDRLPKDVDALIKQLENCGECQACMEACPICEVDFPRRGNDGHYQRQDVMRWLVSCAGCGMCEQTCANKIPLSAFFGHIRAILDEEFAYVPGASPEESLPSI